MRIAIEQLRINQARLAATAEETLASYRAVEETWRRSRMLIANSRTGRADRNFLEKSSFARLQARLETMPVIEQAKGLIVGRTGCRPDQAFDVLRQASQRANVPVRALAAQLVKDSIRRTDAARRTRPDAEIAPPALIGLAGAGDARGAPARRQARASS